MKNATLVSIDPGLRNVGLAIWDLESGTLVEAAHVDTHGQSDRRAAEWRTVAKSVRNQLFILDYQPDDVAYEYFRIRTWGQSGQQIRATQDDVLQLAGVMGAVSMIEFMPDDRSHWHHYKPQEWTSNRSKGPNQQRVWRRLSDDEKLNFCAHTIGAENVDEMNERVRNATEDRDGTGPGKYGHVLDAVGVGLYHLRRL